MNETLKWTYKLLNWYLAGHRNLPWRSDQDPYKIWVSEVMLQQTQVDTVIPYYRRFMDKFPTLVDLAQATEEEVLKAWEGLGYYSRARHLHSAVQEVADKYGGRVPEQYEQFKALPGVGEYTAGAVLSIGYGVALPAVDGNVLRVFSRYFGIRENVNSARIQKQIRGYLLEVMPKEQASDFNQALMELGALVCRPSSPSCTECPINDLCVARREGLQSELPNRSRVKRERVEHLAVLLLKYEGAFLIRKRPAKGLLANLWEFPHAYVEQTDIVKVWEDAGENAIREIGASLQGPLQYEQEYTHVFSHLTWKIQLFTGNIQKYSVEPPYRWIEKEHIATLPFGQVFAKILNDHVL